MLTAMMLSAGLPAEAQNLGDLMKLLGFGGSAETKEQAATTSAPTTKLTAKRLRGKWHYAEPASRYDGNDMLGSFGMKAVESMLPAMYAKAGLDSTATLTFAANGTASGQIGDYKVTGRYTFNESDGSLAVSASIGGTEGVLHGTATLEEGVLTLLFDAQEAASIVERVSSKAAANDTFRMMKTLLDSYPGVKMGCRMKQ